MSRSGRLVRFFGDDDHEFKIGIGEAEELDEQLGFGLWEVLERCSSLHLRDIGQVLRVGLVGGGMKRDQAATLVKRHLVDGYFLDCAQVAAAVLEAAIRGAPDDPQGESEAVSETPPPSQTAGSSSPRSTQRPARSGSRRRKSEG